jgi:hypothetical protein
MGGYISLRKSFEGGGLLCLRLARYELNLKVILVFNLI